MSDIWHTYERTHTHIDYKILAVLVSLPERLKRSNDSVRCSRQIRTCSSSGRRRYVFYLCEEKKITGTILDWTGARAVVRLRAALPFSIVLASLGPSLPDKTRVRPHDERIKSTAGRRRFESKNTLFLWGWPWLLACTGSRP